MTKADNLKKNLDAKILEVEGIITDYKLGEKDAKRLKLSKQEIGPYENNVKSSLESSLLYASSGFQNWCFLEKYCKAKVIPSKVHDLLLEIRKLTTEYGLCGPHYGMV
jgi:hypothetical protein